MLFVLLFATLIHGSNTTLTLRSNEAASLTAREGVFVALQNTTNDALSAYFSDTNSSSDGWNNFSNFHDFRDISGEDGGTAGGGGGGADGMVLIVDFNLAGGGGGDGGHGTSGGEGGGSDAGGGGCGRVWRMPPLLVSTNHSGEYVRATPCADFTHNWDKLAWNKLHAAESLLPT